MKRILIYFFVIFFAFIFYTSPVFAAGSVCNIAFTKVLNKYDSSNFGEDFWLCKGQNNFLISDQCLNDKINCVEPTAEQCKDYIFNTIAKDQQQWEPAYDDLTEEQKVLRLTQYPYDGSYKSCDDNPVLLLGLPGVDGVPNVYKRRDRIQTLISSQQKKYSSSSDAGVAEELENILTCGFASHEDESKRICCTNTIKDIDAEKFEQATIDPNSTCIGDLEWPQGGCVLKPEIISSPIKSFVLDQLNARLDQAELALEENPVPQCIVGEAVGEGSSCLCQQSGGSKICGDTSPNVNVPTVKEYRNITKYKELGVLDCASFWNNDPTMCNRVAELEKDPEVIKYNNNYSKCSNQCMDLNNDTSAEKKIYTAIGCITASPQGLINTIFKYLIGLAGTVAMGCIIYAAFLLQTSSGEPERVKSAQELMTSCITGLIMIIFSVLILQIIGVKILQIPGFGS